MVFLVSLTYYLFNELQIWLDLLLMFPFHAVYIDSYGNFNSSEKFILFEDHKYLAYLTKVHLQII